MFHVFQVTRRTREGRWTGRVVLPCDPSREDGGYWVARLQVVRAMHLEPGPHDEQDGRQDGDDARPGDDGVLLPDIGLQLRCHGRLDARDMPAWTTDGRPEIGRAHV